MAEMTPQEANAAGLGWAPKDHPLYGTKGMVGYQEPGAAPAPAGGATGAPGAQGTVGGQAGASQTYSPTPGAPPSANTSNQGTQDVVRNSYLQQATQGTAIDRNAPEFRQQVDAFSGQADRARRQYESEAAERLSTQGLGNSGAMTQERRLGAERAGQAKGGFEAQLVGRELENRRTEIQNALQQMGGMISEDQRMQLQKQLADLDAALRREGLGSTAALGGRELDIRERLGQGGLNLEALGLQMRDKQFGQDLGYRIGATEAEQNNAALRAIYGG